MLCKWLSFVCNDVNYTGRNKDCTLCCGTGKSIPSALEEFLNEVNAFTELKGGYNALPAEALAALEKLVDELK